jgi:hypothetical protein
MAWLEHTFPGVAWVFITFSWYFSILALLIMYGAVTRPNIQCAVGFKVGNLRAVKVIVLRENGR